MRHEVDFLAIPVPNNRQQSRNTRCRTGKQKCPPEFEVWVVANVEHVDLGLHRQVAVPDRTLALTLLSFLRPPLLEEILGVSKQRGQKPLTQIPCGQAT